MASLDPRQKAERIAALFRERRQTDILPAELMPADLDEAYAVGAAFEEIAVAPGRGAVAGNVWDAGVVLGAPVTDWRRLDLAAMTARLTINGREIGSGKGGDVMGNPLNALAWLADKLAGAGTPLRRGMVVMTGSMVPIQFPAAGDRAVVEVERL